jgi:hypothetical protein
MNVHYTGKNRPTRAKESQNRNLMQLSEQLLELINVLNEASKNFIIFSLELGRLKIQKPFAHVIQKVLV